MFKFFFKAEAQEADSRTLNSKREPVILETTVTKLVPPKEETRPSRIVIRDKLKKEELICK
ncbi:hypothetical protein JCM14036_07790 [Desulfotomaculum defluvii]